MFHLRDSKKERSLASRQREEGLEKKEEGIVNCLTSSLVVVPFLRRQVVFLIFIPATAPPRLTGPGPAAAWLVAVAAAEAAAVQATLRRLERDRERRRGSKAQRSLSLSRNFMSATVFLTSMR